MSTKTCSVVTLSETEGLIKDLLSKLNGKKGRIWLEAYKHCSRKENAWSFKEIMKVSEGMQCTLEVAIAELKRRGLDVFDGLSSYFIGKDVTTFGGVSDNYKKPSIVAVKLKDLIPFDKIGILEYYEIIKEAERRGFNLIPQNAALTVALLAVINMIELQVEGDRDEFVVCSRPFVIRNSKGGFDPRVPYVARNYPCGNANGGYATMLDVSLPQFEQMPHVLRNPRATLIFYWEE